jgi:O-antigen/teichoic acid export membrane protein
LITVTFGVSYTAVFGVMAAAAVASALTAARFIRPARPDRALLREIRQEHWKYGRWSVSATIVQWLPGNIWFLLLPLWAGLEGNAALRALGNLNLAIGHMMTAVSMLLVPILVRPHASSSERFRRLSILATMGVGTLCLGYWAVVTVFGESIVSLMYDGKYTEYAHDLAILGLVPLLQGITVVYGSRARAAERPEIIFRSALAGLLPVAPGIGLTYYYGLSGAIYSQLLVQAMVMIVLVKATRGEVSSWRR